MNCTEKARGNVQLKNRQQTNIDVSSTLTHSIVIYIKQYNLWSMIRKSDFKEDCNFTKITLLQ